MHSLGTSIGIGLIVLVVVVILGTLVAVKVRR